MTAGAIARVLGGHRNGGGYLVRCPVPGHGKGRGDRDASLSIRDGDRTDVIIYCHGGCDNRDVLAELVRRGLIERNGDRSPPDRVRVVATRAAIADRNADDAARTRHALAIWHSAVNPAGTLVEAYLSSRGLHLGGAAGLAVRFHPSLRYDGALTPGMVALFRDVVTDEPTGIHRTFFDAQGHKLDRKMLGRAKDAAIKLSDEATVSTGIGIAEGVETALSVIGSIWRPVWAMGSATGIERFPVLPGVEAISIFADHDNAGIASAGACARRWADAGLEARILRPPGNGADWN